MLSTPDSSATPESNADLIWVQGQAVTLPAGQWPEGRTPRAVLRLDGPVKPEWRRALAQARLTVRFWCPPTGVCVQMPPAYQREPSRLAQLGFVVGGADYTEDLCRRAAAPVPAPGAAQLPGDWYDLVCFDREAAAAVRLRLEAMDIAVLAGGTSKLRVRFTGDAATLRELPGVKLVGRPRLPRLLSASALRASLGALAQPPAAWQLDGTGEIIAVADTGLDSGDAQQQMHPDFSGRIRALVALPTDPSWLAVAVPRADDAADRASGHGTHVAGLACGNGQASGGRLGGMAPGAQLVFLAIEQQLDVTPGLAGKLNSGFHLSGRPLDLRDLYRAGAAHGARLHNLSWGDASEGRYDNDCYETDLYLREEPGATIVCAAGNDGVDRDGNRRADSGSIYSPACAKNTIAVGATEGPLQGKGSRATWGDLDLLARRWRTPADRADAISGEPDRIAPITSAGPTHDGRIKPDLCAPGINLPSTRSRATSAQGWGYADPIPFYMYDGGTSMAAPMVTGALALLRQAWRRAGRRPSGAGLKALALLACTPVRARDGSRARATEAGFGRLDLARALPPALRAVPRWRVSLRDALTLKVDTGQRREFSVPVRAGARLRAVLVWTDPAGERLVNDLDLSLLDAGGRLLALGGGPDAPATAPDRVNPVECLDLAGLAAGTCQLRVDGFNVMDGPQRFALAWAVEDPAP